MRRMTLMLAMGAALAVSACGGDRISYYQVDNYDSSHLGDSTKYGPIPVRVYGEPRAGSGELATANAVAQAMTGANIGTPVEYVAAEQLPADGYVMIVQFGGGAAPGFLCRDGGEPGGVGGDYAAAFCLGETNLSYAAGNVGDSDIASSGFRQAMSTAAVIMLPPVNPNFEDCAVNDCN